MEATLLLEKSKLNAVLELLMARVLVRPLLYFTLRARKRAASADSAATAASAAAAPAATATAHVHRASWIRVRDPRLFITFGARVVII